MDLLCPECLALLTVDDGNTATCTAHGGRYRVLFARKETPVWDPVVQGESAEWKPVVPQEQFVAFQPTAINTQCPHCGQAYDVPPEQLGQMAECTNCLKDFQLPVVGNDMCIRHPAVRAACYCAKCGIPICQTCGFAQADGSQFCPDCAMPAAGGKPVVNEMCPQHPTVSAIQLCKACGAPVCATCDFEFPGGIHMCPTCATKRPTGLSSPRRKGLFFSYLLAIWTTVWMALLVLGAFAALAETPDGEDAMGVIFLFTMLVPAVIGTAVGVGCIDRRLQNPAVIWGAVIWNSLLLAVLVLLMIAGVLAG